MQVLEFRLANYEAVVLGKPAPDYVQAERLFEKVFRPSREGSA